MLTYCEASHLVSGFRCALSQFQEVQGGPHRQSKPFAGTMDGVRERKRRKWDVSAPQGVPVQQGATAPAPATATSATGTAMSSNGIKAGQPLDAAAIARAQQGAAAIMQKINQVRLSWQLWQRSKSLDAMAGQV